LKQFTNILILLCSISCYAQNSEKIELLYADKLSNGPEGSGYWICSGNVSFSHKNTIMNCDYSHHYVKKNKMIAFKNVLINQGDTLTVKGQKLIYDGNNNLAHLSGDVLLKDKYTQLTTNEIFYNLENSIAHYPKKAVISEKNLTLSSEKGYYNTKSHLFNFKKNVRVNSQNYEVETDTLNYNSISKISYFLGPSYIYSNDNTIYCENGWYDNILNKSQFQKNAYITNGKQLISGDSLYYDRNLSYGKAINNISIIDSANNIILNGELGEYFENENKIEVTKKAILSIVMESDTLFISSKKFTSISDKKEYIYAYPNVKIYKKDFQGKCDSLYYSITDSVAELYKKPVIWTDDMQITSDSIQIEINNKQIRKMNLYPNALIALEVDSSLFNQIKGKYMISNFKENKISDIDIFGNGQSLFVIQDEFTKDNIGLNKAVCTDIFIKMNDGKLSYLNYKTAPTSTTIPFQEVLESDKYLDGFNWRVNERPHSKKDIIQ